MQELTTPLTSTNTVTASKPASAILSLRNLSVGFGQNGKSVRAVEDLSFDLAMNKTLAIVGESGSGKSITSLALLGLVHHLGGSVLNGSALFNSRVLGREVDLNSLSEKELRKIRGDEISMIFQEPMTSLNPVYTIGTQISETLMLHRGVSAAEARRLTKDYLDLVRLPDALRLLDAYPHQLSGGMRQRAMIAMALSCQPKILIADEPTTALDVTIQAQILHIIRELQAELGTAVIFISHDMSVVSEMADDVLVMKSGRMVEQGSVEKVLLNPEQEYTQALLAAVPQIGSMKGQSKPKFFMVPGLSEGTTNPSSGPQADHNTKAPLLETKGLTKRFDIRKGLFSRITHRVHAAEQVSLQLYPGETLALVGESGSGKSTVGKTIQQLIEPTSGEVHFDGQSIFKLPKLARQRFRREIQYIFQDPYGSLNPRLTVGQSIMEPALTHGIATSKVEAENMVGALLEKVGLQPEHAQRYPHEFSGGQRQRICIARALICDPKVIIADESVSALDVSVQAQVLNLMMQLQQERALSYLFITHDMAVVERVAHRVAVMYLGQLVEIGSRQQVFENPQHDYTKRLLDAVPHMDPSRGPGRFKPPLEGEIPSPMRAVGNEPAINKLEQIAPGHFVSQSDFIPS
ncbi:ABC transporter ATP-binding protein [Polycladidibacter hongkongensis]|uniref:ABC transporter ATP-binding protein n=1 Tax=Polycladidibacter hongkongensis TaxID=1647556 RepID=UPI000AF24F53|nr:ABC transporter ATP-binding protein [Pseudovibrio hongkongensis]